MEAERPRQRRRIIAAEDEPRSIHDVPDDLVRLILLRLDSPLWLVRAACACRLFRRAVAGGGRAFLRLAGSLHPPAVVGHYHDRSGRPMTFVPSSRPLHVDGGRFFLDFLPQNLTTSTDWDVADCHGGLVLLRDGFRSLSSIIVCDPLTRRYQGINHPPGKRTDGYSCALLDGDGDISISNFRVLYRFNEAPWGCVFCTADGGNWRFLTRQWAAYTGHVAGRVDGSLYLGLTSGGVVALDNASLEFSEVKLPISIDTSASPYRSSFTVVHGAGSDPTTPPATWIIHVYGEELEFFRLVRGEWVLEHVIPQLSEATRGLAGCPEKRLELTLVDVTAAGTGMAVLSAWDPRNRKWVFSIDMNTKELQVVPKMPFNRTRMTFTYTLPWRQFLRVCPT